MEVDVTVAGVIHATRPLPDGSVESALVRETRAVRSSCRRLSVGERSGNAGILSSQIPRSGRMNLTAAGTSDDGSRLHYAGTQ